MVSGRVPHHSPIVPRQTPSRLCRRASAWRIAARRAGVFVSRAAEIKPLTDGGLMDLLKHAQRARRDGVGRARHGSERRVDRSKRASALMATFEMTASVLAVSGSMLAAASMAPMRLSPVMASSWTRGSGSASAFTNSAFGTVGNLAAPIGQRAQREGAHHRIGGQFHQRGVASAPASCFSVKIAATRPCERSARGAPFEQRDPLRRPAAAKQRRLRRATQHEIR